MRSSLTAVQAFCDIIASCTAGHTNEELCLLCSGSYIICGMGSFEHLQKIGQMSKMYTSCRWRTFLKTRALTNIDVTDHH